jgi:hypothetical protein
MYGASTRLKKHTASCETVEVSLYMAGDIEHAKQVIRLYCKNNPTCVTVTPTTFIYRGGEEAGFVVGFRNYPRFPSDLASLEAHASPLAEELREQLGQDSHMIVSSAGTVWSTTREGSV